MSAPRVRREKQWGYVDGNGEVRWFNFEWRYVGTTNVPNERAAREYLADKLEAGRRSGVLGDGATLQLVSRTHVRSVWERTLPKVQREGSVR